MIPVDLVRPLWVVGLGVGTAIMLVVLALTLIVTYAVSVSTPSRAVGYRQRSHDDVWDQVLLTSSVALLWLAGVLSYFPGHGGVVILMLVAGAYVLVALGVVKLLRWRTHLMPNHRKKGP